MIYSNIQVPLSTFRFDGMSRAELKQYYQWYMDVMPDRIAILAKAVQSTSGYESWIPSFLPDSLNLLGEWYAAQVESRPRTSKELELIQNELSFPIDINSYELTDRTFSLAIDLGMYIGQVFVHEFPTLTWHQHTKRKTMPHYGHAIIVWFGKVEFNPTHMMVVLAYGLVDRTKNGKRLREIYDIWAKKLG